MRDENGSLSLPVLSAAAVLCVIMVMISECCYIVTVREWVKNAADLTLGSAVEYSTVDGYRRDEDLMINGERAACFFEDGMMEILGIDGDGWRRDSRGRQLWRYIPGEVKTFDNGISAEAEIEIRPYMLTSGVFGGITVKVDVKSKAYINHNR